MTKTEEDVRVVMVRLKCDCGQEMKPGSTVYLTNPLQYPHECPSCGATSIEDRAYPSYEYRHTGTGEG